MEIWKYERDREREEKGQVEGQWRLKD